MLVGARMGTCRTGPIVFEVEVVHSTEACERSALQVDCLPGLRLASLINQTPNLVILK
jgi:hypothetical protein